ncbi:hypothetical protein Tco_0574385 [Tanacetum coccineum]
MVLRIVSKSLMLFVIKKSDNSNESLVEKQVSQEKSSFVESSFNVDKETAFPVNKKVEFTKPNHEKPVNKSVSKRGPLIILEGLLASYTGQVNAVRVKGVMLGCSRHMTGNIAYLLDFKEFDGGYVAFGGGAYGGRRKLATSEKISHCSLHCDAIWDDTSTFDLPSKLEDMFTMGVSSTLEATHIESFSDEDELEVDLGNIINSYKQEDDKTTSEQIEPTSIAKALSDLSWVEAMQEELLQFKLQ